MKFLNTKITAILLVVISLFVGGCSEDIYYGVSDGTYIPSLEKIGLTVWFNENTTIGSEGGPMTGHIYSYNPWSFSEVPSWLTVSPMSGEGNAEFTITAAANDSLIAREAIFHVTADSDVKITKTFTVSQVAAEPYVDILGRNMEYGFMIGATAQALTADVKTNMSDLTVSINQTWATVSYSNETKKLIIEVEQFGGWVSRDATITFYSPSTKNTSTWGLRQSSASSIMPSGAERLYFDADGGNKTIKVTAATGMEWTVRSDESWIELTPQSGKEGDFDLTINVLPYYGEATRQGMIYYCYGDVSSGYYTYIEQTGRYINLWDTNASVDCEGNSKAGIVVESNIEWEVTSCPSWLKVTPDSGQRGETTITFGAEKNNSLNPRSGTVVISDTHSGAIVKEIVVTQDGLELGNSSMEFGWQASTRSMEIPFPGQWVAAVSEGWITMSKYSGTGVTDVTVGVTKNESQAVRKGTIDFTTEGKTLTVTVVQSGQYLSIDDVSGEVGAMGGKIELAYLSSVGNKHSVDYLGGDDGWISVDASKTGYYTLSVAYNPSVKERTANFVIMPTMSDVSSNISQGVKYAVKQRGRSISTDVSRIDMNSVGGTSSTYIVKADGDYTITKDANDYWYSLVADKTNNTFYIVVTENNTDADRVGKLTLSLGNLPNGESLVREVEIVQHKYGINLNFGGFQEDEIW